MDGGLTKSPTPSHVGIFRRPPPTIADDIDGGQCLPLCIQRLPHGQPPRVQNKLTSAVSPVTQCDIFSFSFELSALDANAKSSTERPHLEEVRQRERT